MSLREKWNYQRFSERKLVESITNTILFAKILFTYNEKYLNILKYILSKIYTKNTYFSLLQILKTDQLRSLLEIVSSDFIPFFFFQTVKRTYILVLAIMSILPWNYGSFLVSLECRQRRRNTSLLHMLCYLFEGEGLRLLLGGAHLPHTHHCACSTCDDQFGVGADCTENLAPLRQTFVNNHCL